MAGPHGRRFLGLRVPEVFAVDALALAPGTARAYDEAEWWGAIVSVERGVLELVCVGGGRRRFAAGSLLWLTGLPLRALRSCGPEPLLLVAVSRPADESRRPRVSAPHDRQARDAKEAHTVTSSFVWFELHSKDSAVVEDFYGKLLGWNIQRDGQGPAMIAGENGPWGAIVAHGADESAWVPYVQVDDVEEATARAVELGASVLQGAVDGPAGRYSTIRDAGGAPVALWQPRD